jgi:hypothetical protein
MKKIIFGFFVILLFLSCDKSENLTTRQNKLIGIWQNEKQHFIDDLEFISYTRNESLDENQYALVIENDKDLYEIKYNSKCASVPIHYEKIIGTYELEDDFLEIKTSDWRGNQTLKYKIIEVSDASLELQIVK